MSTILDALRKASEERSHVRSPLAQGQLYAQSRIQQPAPVAADGGSAHGITTAALAVGALVLTASVFIAIVVWASRTAGATHQPPAALQPPLAAAPAAPAAAPAAASTAPGVPSRVEQYLATQLQPPAPIPVAPAPPPQVASAAPDLIVEVPLVGRQIGDGIVADDDVSRELPPPDSGLAVLPDFERNWEAELAAAETALADEPEPAPEPAPRRRSEPRDDHRLEGIVWSESSPMAIVSGQIVGVGDHVNGAEVTAIAQDSVTLNVSGSERTLRY